MPKSKPATNKGANKAAPAKGGVQKKTRAKTVKKENPLIESKPRGFGIGGDIQPRRDLTRFVRWPKYIRLQRQKRVLLKRLKVPPVINQFNHTIDKSTAQQLFTLLDKYRPETRKEKKQRLLAAAKAETKTEGAAPAPVSTKKPKLVKFGLNHVTALVEAKKAKLVVIAHDVDPIELVMWLPTLCRKKGIPYLIVKGKARLGKVVHQKTAAALALVAVESNDEKDLQLFIQKANENFNERYAQHMKMEGGNIMGYKHNTKLAKDEKRRAKEKKDQEKKQKAAQAPKAAPAEPEAPKS